MDRNILLNIKKFKNKLKRDPFQKVHALLADNYRRVGLTEDAIDTCATGLQIFPSYLLCCEVLGRILLRLGRLEEAREQLEKVHEVVKDNTELNRALAKVYLEMNEIEAARPLFEAVLAKDPFDFEMRTLLKSLERGNSPPGSEDGQESGNGSGIDLFDEIKPQPKVFDMETILAQVEEVGPVAPKEVRVSATDSMLDGLEDAEGVIESSAEKMMSLPEDGEDAAKVRREPRLERRDIYFGKEKELRGAAVLAQMHFEIQLLEEALNILDKIDDGEGDGEYAELSKRLRDALGRKEEELDRLEGQELAKGL